MIPRLEEHASDYVAFLHEQPRKCQQFIQQVMGRLYGGSSTPKLSLSLKEREIVRMAVRLNRPIMAADVCKWLKASRKHAHELLKSLAVHAVLEPASGHVRVRSYRLGPRVGEALE